MKSGKERSSLLWHAETWRNSMTYIVRGLNIAQISKLKTYLNFKSLNCKTLEINNATKYLITLLKEDKLDLNQ
jgi:hypothetical protein